ncbi:MAG: hypothetical protein NC302_12275 [Bacteroidales bacterium]|nr:hypothetical protein [Bacteroidales bacterium]MCM1416476.1 hypothetical protein [bacterium]MCM1424578.1 hypothetical protein [bacterium]
MKCTSCGGDFASDQLRCPYCGAVNEHALELAKELQTYDNAYEKKREELIETGTGQVLRHLTLRMGIVFLALILLAFGCTAFFEYRFSEHSNYEVTGTRLVRNKERIARYLEEKQYIRAYLLASSTDPTGEYFQNYPEYAADLKDIYTYSLILTGVLQSVDSMDAGDDYAPLRDTDVSLMQIFYGSENDSPVRTELTQEIDDYLRNYYQLSDDEIENLKASASGKQFTLEGSADIEGITKKRMEAYFEK